MDPFHLNRFLQAQEEVYPLALAELRSGRKQSHWMWFIFPQLDGLALSPTSRYFAIKSLEEARAYLNHPILGPRLLQCAEVVMDINGRGAREIFGQPDDLKLRSCATLFRQVSPGGSVFGRVLEKYFQGQPDGKTLRLLGLAG